AMATVASETYTAVSAPIQFAAVQAFRGGIAMERYLWHARRILSTLGCEFQRTLAEAGVRVHPPEGGFYLFLDFSPMADTLFKRGIRDGATLCERLLAERGVAILPGSAFGRPSYELAARVAYVNFDGSKALAASETIPLHQELPEDFIPQICPETIGAAAVIASWLKDNDSI
ncbi:MAG TPA: aminotransferase class I/II-fold pyridoxal phosphate-dependent enzyme, partial [Methanothrix sp.]|nr:aminotransferase class I/II-fold pyridoxal phosphate-dependent enzyme [Methanothrix sp.]